MKKQSLFTVLIICMMMTACGQALESEEDMVSETVSETAGQVEEQNQSDEESEEILLQDGAGQVEEESETWEDSQVILSESEEPVTELEINHPYCINEDEVFRIEFKHPYDRVTVRARNNAVVLSGDLIVVDRAFYIRDGELSYLLVGTRENYDFHEKIWLFKLEEGNLVQCGEPVSGMIVKVTDANNIGCMIVTEKTKEEAYESAASDYLYKSGIYEITYDDMLQAVTRHMSETVVDIESSTIVEKVRYEDVSFLERIYEYNGEDFRITGEKLYIKDVTTGEYVVETEFAQMELYSDTDREVCGSYADATGAQISVNVYSSPDFNYSEVGTFTYSVGEDYSYMELFKLGDYRYCTLSGYYLNMELVNGVWTVKMYDKDDVLCGEYVMTEHYEY